MGIFAEEVDDSNSEAGAKEGIHNHSQESPIVLESSIFCDFFRISGSCHTYLPLSVVYIYLYTEAIARLSHQSNLTT